MTITKLKAKNQLTIPVSIIKRLGLTSNEMFAVEAERGCIKLTPVTVEPKYTVEELGAIDYIVEKEKSQGRVLRPGQDFSAYLKVISK